MGWGFVFTSTPQVFIVFCHFLGVSNRQFLLFQLTFVRRQYQWLLWRLQERLISPKAGYRASFWLHCIEARNYTISCFRTTLAFRPPLQWHPFPISPGKSTQPQQRIRSQRFKIITLVWRHAASLDSLIRMASIQYS